MKTNSVKADVIHIIETEAPRANIDVGYLDEPFLAFADGGRHLSPRSGMATYGPHSLGTPRHPQVVRVGIIGTAELMVGARTWLERCAEGWRGDESNPSFPGFGTDRGYFSALTFSDTWDSLITQSEMKELVAITSQTSRFEQAIALFEGKIRLIAERDQAPDYILIVISEEMINRCGVCDFFDKERGQVHRDLRRALKATTMKYRIPTQLVRQRTLEGRDPTHPAKIAWNFFTGLYHKAGGFPWVPQSLEPGSCFVGISFYHPLGSRNTAFQTSLVQAFNEYGEGLILRGHEFEWDADKEGTKSPHLTEQQSGELIELVLDRYQREMGTSPTRVVIQKSSRYWDGERVGFSEALGSRVKRFDLLAFAKQSNVRLIATSKYPPLRGTRFSVGEIDFLYTTGFIPSLNEFHGVHVPSPIQIADHVGQDTPRDQLLSEILALTKLNWNSAAFCMKVPITLKFAELVAEIIKEIPSDREPLPQFKFYI